MYMLYYCHCNSYLYFYKKIDNSNKRMNNFNREKYNKLLRTKLFEIEEIQRIEAKELLEFHARNTSIKSSIFMEKRAEQKRKHFIARVDIIIEALIGSFDDNTPISEMDQKTVVGILKSQSKSYIDHEKSSLTSFLTSIGHNSHNAIVEAQLAALENKLNHVLYNANNKLSLAIDEHNKSFETISQKSNGGNFPILEEEQINLLSRLVEAHRNVERKKRTDFIVTNDMTSASVLHPGFANGSTDIAIVDLRMLDSVDLIKIYDDGNQHTEFSFTLSPLSFNYYEELKTKSIKPIERIEKEIISYINSSNIEIRYSKSFQKWKEAEKLLWVSNTEINLSTIGHLCREAVQEFLDVLVTRHNLQEEYWQKDKTKGRVKALIELRKQTSSDTMLRLFDKLYDFWDMLNNLVQRQEHSGLKERETIVLDDAKRVVIYTILVMNEMDKHFY